MPTSPQETLQSHDVYPCTLTPRAPGPWARPGAMARRAWLRLLGCRRPARSPAGLGPACPCAVGTDRARPPGAPVQRPQCPRRPSPCPPMGPSRRPIQPRAAAAKPRGARPPFAPRPPPLPGAPRSPGAGPRAGHADQGPRGTPRPAPWGHAGAAEAAGAARPRLVQGAGAARSEHGGGAVPQARGQPWANAPHGGRPPRPLGPGGQATRAMAP